MIGPGRAASATEPRVGAGVAALTRNPGVGRPCRDVPGVDATGMRGLMRATSDSVAGRDACLSDKEFKMPLMQRMQQERSFPAAMMVLCLALWIGGCAYAPPRTPLPEALSAQAEIPGFPDIRYWGDETPPTFREWLEFPNETFRTRFAGIMSRPHDYLLISGGGGDGAFGAGLLVGWTAAGTRPEFQIITGISTGAIIAPFAFLGPDYDETLHEVYTQYSTDDLVRRHRWLRFFTGVSAYSTERFWRLLESYIGDAEVAAIAAQGRRGRTLLVGTTQLDAGRPMIWNLTQIAMTDAPGAKELIHRVILASTAIPGIFPPVLFEVEAGGMRYDELHVDGGVTSQIFLGPVDLDWHRIAERLQVTGPPQLHLIRNSQPLPRWTAVEPRTRPIASRAISSLVRSQGIGDLARIYVSAQRGGMVFNLAHVPQEFDREPEEFFDVDYMRALFELGVAMGKDGSAWVSID